MFGSWIECIVHYTTNTDMFSRKIMFTYNGRSSFKTFLGGVITIAVLIVTGLYSFELFSDLFARKRVTGTINSLKNARKHGDSVVTMKETGVKIYVGWFDSQGKPLAPNSIRIYAVGIDSTKMDTPSAFSEVKVSQWGNKTFTSSDDDYKDFSDFWCFDTDNVTIGEEYANKKKHYLEIYFEDWYLNQYWKEPTKIPMNITGSYVEVFIENYYFDVYDVENPVKPYLYKSSLYYVIPDAVTSVLYKMRKNKYTSNDELFSYKENTPKEFYSILDPVAGYLPLNLLPRFTLILSGDTTVDEYERNYLTILDVTGTIGGVFEIIVIFWSFFVGLITNKIFNKDLIQQELDKRGLFSYPAKFKKNYKKRQTAPKDQLNPWYDSDDYSNDFNYNGVVINERNANYFENSDFTRQKAAISEYKKRLENIKEKILAYPIKTDAKQFNYEIDSKNIAISVRELKLYVEYLIGVHVSSSMQNDLNCN